MKEFNFPIYLGGLANSYNTCRCFVTDYKITKPSFSFCYTPNQRWNPKVWFCKNITNNHIDSLHLQEYIKHEDQYW